MPRYSLNAVVLAAIFTVGLLVAVGVLILVGLHFKAMTRENAATASDAVDRVALARERGFEDIVDNMALRLVELRSQGLAGELGPRLRRRDEADLAAIGADEALRVMVTEPLFFRHVQVGSCILITRDGLVVFHADPTKEGLELAGLRDSHPEMVALVERSANERLVSGFYTVNGENGERRGRYVALAQVEQSIFTVAVVINIDDYHTEIGKELRAQARTSAEEAQGAIQATAEESYRSIMLRAAWWGLVLLLLFSLLRFWLARFLVRPIERLDRAASEFGCGHFDFQVSASGPRELVRLAQSFNALGRRLSVYVDRVREESAARQAMESEISVAASIQQALLPGIMPPFPERREFSLHGLNVPARMVGGDLFDFFFRADEQLVLFIGDVSGKGVAAALFMGVAHTLFRVICAEEPEPDRALTRVNQALCANNEACMFVTALLCYYHTGDGRLRYANAGHDAAVLRRADGGLERLDNSKGMALGLDEAGTFAASEAVLAPGDLLFAFTDGVTEALSGAGEFFGELHLLDRLRTLGELAPDALCATLRNEIADFQGSAPHDDLTLLALRRERGDGQGKG